jgi:hypothetical protein
MVIKYRVHLTSEESLEIEAERINLGNKKLWFYDGDDNLQAVFKWDNIQGFSIEGPASGQIIVDELLHERRMTDEAAKNRGPVVTALDKVNNSLKEIGSFADSAWLTLLEVNKKEVELQLLMTTHAADLQENYVRFIGYEQSLPSKLKSLQEEFKSLFGLKGLEK